MKKYLNNKFMAALIVLGVLTVAYFCNGSFLSIFGFATSSSTPKITLLNQVSILLIQFVITTSILYVSMKLFEKTILKRNNPEVTIQNILINRFPFLGLLIVIWFFDYFNLINYGLGVSFLFFGTYFSFIILQCLVFIKLYKNNISGFKETIFLLFYIGAGEILYLGLVKLVTPLM